MKNKKLLKILTLAVVIIGAITYSNITNEKNFIVTIRVADPHAIGGALFHVALEKRYFEDEGIKIEVVGVQTGDEAIRALVGNSADIALGGIIPYSFLALEDQSIKIFATNAYVSDNQVIANKNNGIAIAEDLRGKKIGYSKTTASHLGIVHFLSAHNLKESDVILVNMKPLAMVGALASGQIDAYSSWEPHVLNGKKMLGESAIVFSGDKDVSTWHQALLSRGSYISEHHKDLVKFVTALKKAEKFISTNKNEAIILAAKHNSVPVDILVDIWHRYDLFVSIREDLYAILKTDLSWANTQREKPLVSTPLPQNLVDTSVLKDVKN